MIQRDQWDTYWGAKKLIFLIRDIDDATMAAASVETCRFVVLWCPRGRLGSVLDVRNRLRRMRGCFRQYTYQYRSPASCRAGPQVQQVFDPELSGELQVRAHAA